MNYLIRDMQESDWEKVCSIYYYAVLEGKSTFQTKKPVYENWDKGHLKDCRYVITYNNIVIGWCSISAVSSSEAYWGMVEVSIYIDHEYRGKGAGTQLMEYLCRESEAKGYWCLYSSIFEINKASIALHKNLGFRTIGYREKPAKDRFGEWQNTILMERRSKNI